MRPGALVAVLGVLFAGRPTAAAQGPSDRAAEVPEKAFYFGAAGAGLVSGSPGLAVGGVIAIEWKRLVITAEVAVGETFSGWDMFTAGGQAGAVLLPTMDAPYLLAGVEQSFFADIINEKRGRNDFAFTAEGGYVLRGLSGGRQLWLGVRGIVPITSHVYSSPAPQLPLVVLTARFLL
jgi:hypothetical protein